MVVEGFDSELASQIERYIQRTLVGDPSKNIPGLYRTVLASQSWDTFQRIVGRIHGLEEVLNEMRNIIRRSHEGDTDNERRTGMN